MMSGSPDNLEKQLQQFDLSADEVRVYLHLLEKGALSALKLSKQLGIARTKIYRLTEKMIENGFVIEEVMGKGKRFLAEDPKKFIQIVNEKERELLLLKSSAPTIVGQLRSLQAMISPETKILHYKGLEGLKQVTWNSTKVDGVFRIYELAQSMEGFLDASFAEKVRHEYASKPRNEFRQITNYKEIKDNTSVTDHIGQWEPRYISKDKLDIKVEIQIYNDVYCMYEYTNDDVFIVEIYNQELADMQKQIYDLIWEFATPMKKLNDRGHVILE